MRSGYLLTIPVLIWAGAALAVGETPKTPATPTTASCQDGKIYDAKTQTCIDPASGDLDDDTLYQAGREFADAGRYREAIDALSAVQNGDQPRILTLLGYAERKSGNVEAGLELYAQALQRDPDYLLARSYLGMALVEQGDIVGAWQQYREIEARGGEGTWPHQALRAALEDGTDFY